MAHPDLPSEQAYVDQAYAALDRMRDTLLRTFDAAATEVAAQWIEKWATTRFRTFEDAERGLCFGRIDSEEAAIGSTSAAAGCSHDQGALIVNWQAPAARPFYTATPAEPHGVTLRRRFRARGRALTGISDEALDGSLADAASAVDDFLLEELDRARDQRHARHRRDDPGRPVPPDRTRPGTAARRPGRAGTGKTAVGLHRASYLLYSHRTDIRRVLVVGPNPAFMEYVSHVLPTLGEDSVEQRAVGELVPGVEVTRADPLDVQQLKASLRVGEVVRRAVELGSQGAPQG